ncbi:MAG: hypothetical protein IKO68_12715 [Oscillospiraceae bacterium]|nr:hypothetical protein [Oscillospiraceae bacterium]
MFRRVLPLLLLLPAALLCSCAQRVPPAEASPLPGAPVFSAEALAETRREKTGETESAPPLTLQETETLFGLLSRLSACETGTLGSTRRLAALLPPLWEWVSEHPRSDRWDEALRGFSAGLSEEERKTLSEKLLLFRVMIELPETALNELLEEAGCSGAVLPDMAPFSAFLDHIQTMLP